MVHRVIVFHPLPFVEAAQSVGDAVGSDGIWWVRGLAGAAAGMAAQALVAVPVENIRIRMLMAGASRRGGFDVGMLEDVGMCMFSLFSL